MTQPEALAFLGITDQQDAFDAYELGLFEIKKTFVQSRIIPKLYNSKLKKIEQLFEAYSVLNSDSKNEIRNKNFSISKTLVDSDEILSVFDLHQQNILDLRKQLLEALHPESISEILREMYDRELAYLLHWPDLQTVQSDVIKLSAPVDLMEFRNDILLIKSKGVVHFSEIERNEEILPDPLKIECKRLFLLQKEF